MRPLFCLLVSQLAALSAVTTGSFAGNTWTVKLIYELIKPDFFGSRLLFLIKQNTSPTPGSGQTQGYWLSSQQLKLTHLLGDTTLLGRKMEMGFLSKESFIDRQWSPRDR